MNFPDGAISFPIFGEDFYINPPSAFSLGPLTIHWYGVIIATGFLLAVLYCTRRSKQFGVEPDSLYDVIIWGLPIGLICARAYYVIFYLDLFRGKPFIDYIAIWNGGLAFYGGLIGAAATLIVYCRVKKLPFLPFMDVVSLGFMIGQAIGRWGNFMNREAYGYETDLPWRMGLTYGGATTYVHPTFFYESVWNLIGFLFIHWYSKKHRKFDGEIFLMYLGWYGLGRVWIEGLRTDSLYFFDTGLRVSQLLAGVCAVAAAGILIYVRFIKKPDAANMYVNKLNKMEEE
ncbi:MAG: prolipoprotein diacylglyceryl transferase [Oscillospiraceae bacterium]|nr:prolipoprotein diacylglyceryl transferase [Oscillospiraceae bacterium]